MNNFSAIGRLGRDAEMRYTQGGKAVLGFALAVDKGWGDRKQTVWFDCSLWGDRGEKLAEHLKKGDRIGVTGEFGTREHDGKTYLTLDVRDVTLLGGKPATKPAQSSQPRNDGPFPDDDIPF